MTRLFDEPVEKNHRLYTPQINHISLRMPPSPLLSQLEDVPVGVVCNESTVANCNETFCDCTYTLDIPLGSLVELVLIDEGAETPEGGRITFSLEWTAISIIPMTFQLRANAIPPLETPLTVGG